MDYLQVTTILLGFPPQKWGSVCSVLGLPSKLLGLRRRFRGWPSVDLSGIETRQAEIEISR